MCGFGVRKYTASVSRWSGRRSSMRSMSAGVVRSGSTCRVIRRRTRDVFVEYVVFLDDIVYELAALFVYHQDLPLRSTLGFASSSSRAGGSVRRHELWL